MNILTNFIIAQKIRDKPTNFSLRNIEKCGNIAT